MAQGTIMQFRSLSAIESKYYKLPGVKESLYHPRLPTFRRMDIDTAAHKLPDVHCRTTTPCSTDDFRRGAVTLYVKPGQNEKTNSSRYWRFQNLYRTYTNTAKDAGAEDVGQTGNGNAENTEGVKKSNDPSTPPLPLTTQRSGRQWKFLLQQEPFIDHIGQRPIPATTFSRYRSMSSTYGGQVSTNGWRP